MRPATPEVYVGWARVFTVTVNSGQPDLDIDQLRADTRGCTSVVHLNNAGSALPPAVVVDTMVDFLRAEETMGGYEAHAHAMDRLARVYSSLAILVGTEPDHIALTESATSSWDRGFAAITHTQPFTVDSRILVSSSEYASNVLPIMQVAQRTGASIEFIPDTDSGVTDLVAFAEMLDDSVALVAINHCPSQNGLINDVTGIGKIIRENNPGTWYLVDACQSVGQLPVNAPEIGADFLSVTGRKFMRGPRGTGFLYCSDRALTDLEPFPVDLHGGYWNSLNTYVLHDGARRFESWEKSYAAMLGLGAATDYLLTLGQDRVTQRITSLAHYARMGLATLPGIVVLDRGTDLSGIVTFMHESIPAEAIVSQIRAAGINVSLGSPDYSQVDYIGHGVSGLVRVSPHVFNTEAEIDLLVETVGRITD